MKNKQICFLMVLRVTTLLSGMQGDVVVDVEHPDIFAHPQHIQEDLCDPCECFAWCQDTCLDGKQRAEELLRYLQGRASKQLLRTSLKKMN